MGRTEAERAALVQCGSCYHFVPPDADGLPTPNHICYRADPSMRAVRAAAHAVSLEMERLRAERDLLAAELKLRRRYSEIFSSPNDLRALQDAEAAVDAAGCLTDGESGSS